MRLSLVVFVSLVSACDLTEGLENAAFGDPSRGQDDDSAGATDAPVEDFVTPPEGGAGPGQAVNLGQNGSSVDDDQNGATELASMDVTLDVRVHVVTVGGTVAAEAQFEWNASRPDAVVTVQMKTELDPRWVDILPGLPSADVGSYSLPTYASQTFWFRAVATSPGATPATSAIIRVD